MADSNNEEAFHSAGEEDITPPSHYTKEGSLESSASTSGKDSTDEEAKNTVKLSSKKKGKKGKKKTTYALDTKGDKEDLKEVAQPGIEGGNADSTEEITVQSKEESSQLSKLESKEEEQKQSDTEAEMAKPMESELRLAAEKVDQTSANAKVQEDPSPTTEDSELKDEPLDESGDTKDKSDSEVPQGERETKHLQEGDEQLLETGNKISRDVPSESSKLGDENAKNETVGDVLSGTSAKQTDVASNAEASVGERNITGALGRLTGEKPEEKKATGGGWGWGGWGASFVSSVSAVGHGLSSVIENVETSLGLPKPEELTEQEKREQQFIVTSEAQEGVNEGKEEDGDGDEEARAPGDEEKIERDGAKMGDDEKRQDETTQDDPSDSSSKMKGFLSLGASAITRVVGKTVTGGLDALETIGRKTMDVLQEGDHGAVKDRSRGQKGNLSEMLRDAKEEVETAALLEEEEKERQRAHFGILFDQYQGLAHLEALEMLSNQSERKVQGSLSMLSGDDLQSLKTELIEIRDAFQLEDLESEEQPTGSEQEFVNTITEHLFGVSVASTPDKLQKVQRSVHEWLAECRSQQEAGQKQDIKELHIKAIETLAEFSSRVIEQFHKACELMLLPQDKEHSKSPVQRATSLSKLTSVLVTEVSNQAVKFGDCLNQEATNREGDETTEDINPLMTNIYLEASNSTSYIQDAFQLVLPVLQMVAMERKKDATSEAM